MKKSLPQPSVKSKLENTNWRIPSLLLLIILLTGFSITPLLAQDYKQLYNAALAAAKEKDYPTARENFMKAAPLAEQAGDAEIARKSRYVAAQIDYKLGVIALKAREYEQALTHYRNGLAIYPAYLKNRYGEGLALKKLGRLEEALKAWSEVEKSKDRKTSRLARTAIRDHFYYQASTAVGKENATPADADRALAAIAGLSQYLEPDADYYYYTAVAHKIKGAYNECVKAAEMALEVHRGSRSDKAKIYLVKGEGLMMSGDNANAKIAFQNAAYGRYRVVAEQYLSTLQ